jgi:hypothetical protein
MPDRPVSRGIPSKEALWFNILKLPKSLDIDWELSDVLFLIYPPELTLKQKKAIMRFDVSPKQYEIACDYINLVTNKNHILSGVRGKEVEQWREQQNISKSTLANIQAKLRKMGIIDYRRFAPSGRGSSEQHKESHHTISMRFPFTLKKIAEQYEQRVRTKKELAKINRREI